MLTVNSSLLAAVSLLLVLYWGWKNLVRSHNLPPGPPSLPLVGNLHHIPTRHPWIGITHLQKRYGDLVHFHGLGYKVVFLNTLEAINDLLEKRSHLYSHRPVFTLGGELMGMDQSMVLRNYDSEWREHRKLAHISLSPTAIKRYHSKQENIAAAFCQDLLHDPGNFYEHAKLAAGRVVMSVTYGLSIEAGSQYVRNTEDVMTMTNKTIVPAAHLCDIVPALKYLPEWLPFRKYARMWKERIETDVVDMPFEHVKEEMQRGNAAPSLASHLLSSESAADNDYRVKWVLSSMFTAGSETTYGILITFILAMARYPEKQKLAQAELDNVLFSENRAPLISDMPRLPYVNALIKEVMRWHPILPFSIGRQCAADDVYRGYKIPKGTIVVPNVWAVAKAPDDKYDPHEFLPERFLGRNQETVLDPYNYIFGFGRRICPGKLLGQNSLFIFIASVLYSCTISLPSTVSTLPEFDSGLVSYPELFQCDIVPRIPEDKL
ncbi:hypothetical protein VNI00_010900 [Paramarasmius palmivorus]|uniref:Cytochrome P450 n=1 Tax=Paramarasmius palmivorus TaxID=297713 RepID=A0AAW0CHH0_9AGAR